MLLGLPSFRKQFPSKGFNWHPDWKCLWTSRASESNFQARVSLEMPLSLQGSRRQCPFKGFKWDCDSSVSGPPKLQSSRDQFPNNGFIASVSGLSCLHMPMPQQRFQLESSLWMLVALQDSKGRFPSKCFNRNLHCLWPSKTPEANFPESVPIAVFIVNASSPPKSQRPSSK